MRGGVHVRHALRALLAAWTLGCVPAEIPATQLVVTLDGEASVLARLHRVRATLYPTDASRTMESAASHEFVLAGDGAQAGVQAPFTFGVVRGGAPRVKLVIEGFDAPGADAAPVIEQKLIAAFASETTLHVRVTLEQGCYALPNPCSGLDRTCSSAARACAPVTEVAATREPVAIAPDAGTQTSACPTPSPCAAEYPCTPTLPSGYACLGQRTTWPVPLAGPGMPSRYELVGAQLVRDKITNLVWQREYPLRYEGCTGTSDTLGDLCTADEARVYCSRLRLADRSWRLPTKAALETLVDYSGAEPSLDASMFPGKTIRGYWTSSPQPRSGADPVAFARYWSVNFRSAMSMPTAPTESLAVRCVSGIPPGRGTPETKYVVDDGTDTVGDRDTGLVWKRTESDALASLEEAVRYCADLGAGWRLPHVKELLSIVDPARIDPALAPGFSAPRSGLAWATAGKPGSSVATAWVVDELLGSAFPQASAERQRDARHAAQPTPHARCVRSAEDVP